MHVHRELHKLLVTAVFNLELPTSRVHFFFHEREGRVVDFLCFLRQNRVRELGPTTGTGNERRRTLRALEPEREFHEAGMNVGKLKFYPYRDSVRYSSTKLD